MESLYPDTESPTNGGDEGIIKEFSFCSGCFGRRWWKIINFLDTSLSSRLTVHSDLISTEAIVELEVNGRLGYRFPTYFFFCSRFCRAFTIDDSSLYAHRVRVLFREGEGAAGSTIVARWPYRMDGGTHMAMTS